MTFDPNRPFHWKSDVRDREALMERIRSKPMHGALWPLIGSRRSGKTWTLMMLEHLLNDQDKECAKYVSLDTVARIEDVPDHRYLLLDEPELSTASPRRQPREVLEWCAKQKQQGRNVVLAMSPAEARLLLREGRSPVRVSEKERLYVAPLTEQEARTLARTSWAGAMLGELPPGWSSNPFLLELFFSRVEARPEADRRVTPALLQQVIRECDEEQGSYFRSVFVNGLDAAQREFIRQVARGESPEPGEHEILVGCGLLRREGRHCLLVDPVLDALLKPLKIHQVTDIHIGPKAAQQGDRKEQGAHGVALSEGAGHAFMREKYRDHLKELSESHEAPQVLIISGDIVEKSTPEQLTEARRWVDSLRPFLSSHPLMEPEEARILLVGGNHDVDWSEALGVAGSRKRHEAFARTFEGFIHPGLQVPPDERKLASVAYPNLGLEILLLGSAEFGGEPREEPELIQLLALVDSLRKEADSATGAEEAEKLRKRVARIDPGLVHHKDLSQVKGRKWRQPVNVAVLHHPVSPLPATEIARFSGLLNAGAVKQALLDRRFCLVLHGHMHTGWFGKEQWPETAGGWTLRIAAAPSLGSQEVQQRHGFNQIEVSRLPEEGEREYRVTVRRFERDGDRWVEVASMSFRPGKAEDEPPPGHLASARHDP